MGPILQSYTQLTGHQDENAGSYGTGTLLRATSYTLSLAIPVADAFGLRNLWLKLTHSR